MGMCRDQSLCTGRELKPWLPKYPDIKIEISSDNRFADIVAERFDIGIRLGDDVAKNMIVVRIAPDMRLIVVGSPEYFDVHPRPTSPQDLESHDCISLREFIRGNRNVNAHVKGRLVFNQSDMIVDAALTGQGVTWLPEDIVQKQVPAGRPLTALDDWSITYPGYHLYYASRRSVVEVLRHIKAGRSSRVL
jgi:DNA-binding transcriptional LysR family regulator